MDVRLIGRLRTLSGDSRPPPPRTLPVGGTALVIWGTGRVICSVTGCQVSGKSSNFPAPAFEESICRSKAANWWSGLCGVVIHAVL